MIQNENAGVRRIAGNFKIIAIVCLIPIVFQMRKNACREISFDVKLTVYSGVVLLFIYRSRAINSRSRLQAALE